MDRRHGLSAGLAVGVVGVAVRAHRARAVERDRGRDVFEAVRLHLAQQRPGAPAVELEHPERVAAPEDLVGLGVGHVLGQRLEVDVVAAVGAHVGDRVVEDGEVAQAEEVHLDQPERLAARVVELGDDLPVLFAAHDRDELDERLAAHDDAGGVDPPLAFEPLEAKRGGDDLLGLRVLLVQRTELGRLAVPRVLGVEDTGQRHVPAHDRRGHRLGELLAHGERVPEHAGGVLERLLGLDRAVGDDLGDPVVAVLLGDVADDLAPATLVEVDVEVGHRHALGVEETLEDQAVLDRVEVGDPHGVGAHGPGAGPAAGSDPDAVVLGPVDEVGHDEEVTGVPLADDDVLLVAGLRRGILRNPVGIAHPQAPLDLLDEPGLLGLPRGAGEPRHVAPLTLDERDVAALGDQQGVVAGLRQLAEQMAHLLRGLEVELVGVELEPTRVHEGRTRLHAQQRGVRRGVRCGRVVQVVRREQRQAKLGGQAQQLLVRLALDRDVVVHDLGVEVLGAEDVAQLGGCVEGLAVLPETQPRVDLAAGAPGRRDQPTGIPRQQLAVDPGLEVVPLEGGQRAHPEQVVHALGRAGEQRHVGVGAGPADVVTAGASLAAELDAGLVAAVGARGEVGLGADDGLDAVPSGLGPELVGPEQVPVVGHGDGRHPHPDRLTEQVIDARRAVEHGVLGVAVQVHEGRPLRAGRGVGCRWLGSHRPGV